MSRSGARQLELSRLLRHGLGQRRPADRRQGLRDRLHHPDREGPAGASSTTSSRSAPRRASPWWRSASASRAPRPRRAAPTSWPSPTRNGLFAGASLEGSYLDADNDWNALYYGAGANGRGDRARPPLHQSRRRADPAVPRQVVARLSSPSHEPREGASSSPELCRGRAFDSRRRRRRLPRCRTLGDRELGLGLGLDLVDGDAVGELTRVTPPGPCLSIANTPSSVITMSTTRLPVSGRVHSFSSFD